jgi:hypothetical protein
MGKWVKLVDNSNATIGLSMISGFDRYHDANFFERNQIGELGAGVSVPSYVTNFENPPSLTDTIFSGTTTPRPDLFTPVNGGIAIWSVQTSIKPSVSLESARSYFSEMSSMDTAVLRKPNTLQRMISVPYPAGFHLGRSSVLNIGDAYKLNSLSFSVNYNVTMQARRPVVDVTSDDQPIFANYLIISASGEWSISFIASVILPGGEIAILPPQSANSNLIDPSLARPLFEIQSFMTTVPTLWSYSNSNGPLTSDVGVLIPAGSRPNINTYDASQVLDDVYNQLDTIFGPF